MTEKRFWKSEQRLLTLNCMKNLENKLDELKAQISYQKDIKNGNILCFTKSWLKDDMNNIQLALKWPGTLM
jgi:hypothetical protein